MEPEAREKHCRVSRRVIRLRHQHPTSAPGRAQPPPRCRWEEDTMAKVLCVLYDDPVTGYPQSYARDDLPKLERYPGGQTLPTPKRIDFKPGQLLGSVSGELGLRKFLEGLGHTLIVTSDKDGVDSVFEKQ